MHRSESGSTLRGAADDLCFHLVGDQGEFGGGEGELLLGEVGIVAVDLLAAIAADHLGGDAGGGVDVVESFLEAVFERLGQARVEGQGRIRNGGRFWR